MGASLEAVRQLEAAWAADPQPGVELVTGTLPVAFAAAGEALRALVEQHRLVYEALAAPLGDGSIHELRIKTRGMT